MTHLGIDYNYKMSFYYVLLSVFLYFFYRSVCWFLNPYFVYKKRTQNKDIEFYIAGKMITKQ